MVKNTMVILARGFTLIELIVVMAILGILSAIVYSVLDPLEQTARARDVGRLHSVAQLGKAMSAYGQEHNGVYLDTAYDGGQWQNGLVNDGLIISPTSVKVIPRGGGSCNITNHGNFCYTVNGNRTDAIIWTVLESKQYTKKSAPDAGSICDDSTIGFAAAVWIASQEKVGLVCIGSLTTELVAFDADIQNP